MSDWIDLKLAHSLTRTKAPDALWKRIEAAQSGVVEVRHGYRWSLPFAIAAAVLLFLLVVRASALELRGGHTEFVSNDPAAMSRYLGHQPGRAPAVRVKSEMANTRADSECRLCHRA